MAKLKSKGVSFAIEDSSIMVPIAQLTSLSISGAEAETFDGRTLDQDDAWVPMLATGYAVSGNVDWEGFYDPQLDSHQLVMATVANPGTFNAELEYSDGSVQDFAVSGGSVDVTFDPADGVRFSGSYPINGDPGFIGTGSGTA